MIKLEAKGLTLTRNEFIRLQPMIKKGIGTASMQVAHMLRREMVLGLRSQRPGGSAIAPLSEMTILLRGLPKSGSGGTRRPAAMQRNVSGPLQRGQKRVRSALRSKGRKNLGASEYGPLAKGQKRSRSARRKKSPKRGPTKALIRYGDLIGGINVKRYRFAHYTVGVHRGERGKKSGNDLVNIAEIHEYGTKKYTVTVTEKMAKFSKFLVVMGILNVPWKQGQTLQKKIDARPFLNPANDVWQTTAQQNFELSFHTAMVSMGSRVF